MGITPESVPKLGFAMVYFDVGSGVKFFADDGLHLLHPPRSARKVDIIQVGKHLLIANHPLLGGDQRTMLP